MSGRIQGDCVELTATMMFVDMVASTEVVRDLDDGRYRDLFATYEAIGVAATREEHGRFVLRCGDGLFSVFASARAGLRAASRIRATVHEADLADQGVAVRIGLHTGDVLVDDETASGVAVYRAARISEGAGANEILVSSETAAAAGDNAGFRFGPGVELSLKGFEAPHVIHQVDPVDSVVGLRAVS